MPVLLSASLRAVHSLFTPGMLVVMALSVALTVTLLTGFIIALSYVLPRAFLHWYNPGMEWLMHYLPWMSGIGAFLLTLYLFPAIMPVIVSFFDGRIARIIEQQEYPTAQPAHYPHFWPELLHDLRFSAVAILLNIAVLPFYLFVPFPLVFYPVNGYLLGREFFVMAARRHMPAQDAVQLCKRHGQTVVIAGIALTLLATIPVVNLLAPFWGVAVMVHLYHRLS